jgi:serine protease Do
VFTSGKNHPCLKPVKDFSIISVKPNNPMRASLCLVARLLLLSCLPIFVVQSKGAKFAPWNLLLPNSVNDLEAIQSRIQNSFYRVKKSVVSVVAEDGAGSGVVVSPEGLILTAAHVIGESGREMKVIFEDGSQARAVSLGGSELSDAGMLKVIDAVPEFFAPIAQSSASAVGDWCFALGHPNGFDQDRGLVLRVGRVIRKKEETMQTDCRLLGGDSGGPLFSIDGEVIGIHSRISQDPEANFHTTIESFHSNWEYFVNEDLHTFQAMQSGGFLGVYCEESTDGLLVLEVVPDTPAEKAGLKSGDLLTHLDGNLLDTREKLTILVSSQSPGSKIVLDYSRKSRDISVRLELGERNSPQ